MRGLRRIISGAQTGVDRAALDSAISHAVYSWGGWVPKGRIAEDGELPSRYFESDRIGRGLKEHTKSRDYKARTLLNIREADATMILRFHRTGAVLSPGTKLTIKTCQSSGKPYRLFDPSRIHTVPRAAQWICETKILEGDDERNIEVLNVAGPRESKFPGIYNQSKIYFDSVLAYVFIYQMWGIKIWAPKRPSAKPK